MSQRKLLQITVIPVALALLYVAGARLGLQLAYVTPTATAVWPPTALALAALLIFGIRLWPVIFLGAVFVNLSTVDNVATVIAIAAGNTIEAVVGAALVQRFARGVQAFDRAADAFRFAGLTTLVATPLSASIGVFSLWMAGAITPGGLGNVWLTWWLGDAAAALVFAPPLMLWGRRNAISPSIAAATRTGAVVVGPARAAEMALLCSGLVLTSFVVFDDLTGLGQGAPLMFLTFPFLSWAVFRLGRRGATTAMAFVSVIAIWGATHGHGPFVRSSPNSTLLLLQAFLAITSVMVFVGAAVVSERNRVEAELQRLATTDPLTGLANYRQLARTLEADLLQRDTEFALLLMDVDGLKSVNDRDGHLAGSRLLGRLAHFLRRACPPGATISRYGGDEFVVALPASGESAARAVVCRLNTLLESDTETPALSVSIGLAMYPRDGRDIDRLLDAADRQVYAAKKATAAATSAVEVPNRT